MAYYIKDDCFHQIADFDLYKLRYRFNFKSGSKGAVSGLSGCSLGISLRSVDKFVELRESTITSILFLLL